MFPAHAIVQSSCTKLRSVIDIGDEVTRCHPLLPGMLDSLVAIQPLLEDAEKRSVRMEYEIRWLDSPPRMWPAEIRELQELAMQGWLRRVTNSAYKISDVLDELQDTRNTAPPPARKTKMFAPHDNVPEKKNPVALNLEEMKDELSKLVVESAQFNLSPFDPGSIVEPITDAPTDGEATLLVRDEEIKRRIVAASDSCEEGPIIVSIVGRNGSGKTSIARLVFNHARFKQYARVWISFGSQKFNLHKIGKSIISQASGEEGTSYNSWDGDLDPITDRLGELLDNGMKVLVVLDDVNLSGEDFIQLKRMLSVGHNKEDTKMMLIVTTEYVTRPETFTVPPLYLESLSPDECWIIIKQRSGFEDRSDKQELESIGREIANRCQGIPLQAAMLGAILRYKDATGWGQAMKLDIICWQLSSCYTPTFLDFAYTSMPPSLRLCFAYFSIFPAGHPVAKHDLIHQWIALRLLEPSDKFSAKELGEQRIRMLQGMSLLQATKPSDPTSGRDESGVIMLTMHPKVHELAASLVCGSDISMANYHRKELFSYRYALATDCDSWPTELSTTLADQLRALRCVGCSKMELADEAFSSATWLRVLELKEHSMQKLPGSICQLRHLGYLNLSGCSRLETLPESFGDLLQLLHIDLSGCSGLVTLPESFGKLIDIVHIDLSGCSKLEKLPESIVKLINLVRIDLAGCSALVRLPELLWKLTDLEHISLSGCSALVHLPGSFGKLINLVYINLSGCSGLVKLPQSFVKLINLPHLNLSGCTGLAKLPGSFDKLKKVTHVTLSGCSRLKNLPASFGKLTKLVHIDLSGCSRLKKLPASFGKLTKLVHIDLSGCCGLETLPESFGDLTDLRHINLSRCYGLSKLPQSFRKLEKLQHLNLSFWSCFGVIRTALVGRSNLQHLNLSHPCCSLAQNQPDLQGLEEVLSQLTGLQYLNLSRFLNPMLDSLSEEKTEVVLKEKEVEIGGYIECISGLSSLEHLDLSHNMFIRDAPECLGGLSKLHTLDLSGCIRLKSIDERIGEMKSLRSLILRNCRSLKSYQLVVQAVDDDGVAYSSHSSNLILLKDADIEELEIRCLDVKSIEDWQKVRLAVKRRLEKLKLCWSVRRSQRSVEDHALPGELGLPQSLQCLEIRGYNGKIYPAVWWENNLINLAEVTLEDVSMCSQLPPLGLLPNLQQLVLRRMTSLTRIDGGDMSFSNRPASKPLPRFTIKDMDNLEQFNTTYVPAYGGDVLMFPAITLLVIENCPKLCFQPLPPRAQVLRISMCDHVMTAWAIGGPRLEGPPLVTELIVHGCKVQLDKWSLLLHLPGLRSLIITKCTRLTSSPEIFGALSSLKTLEFSEMSRVDSLPQDLGDLASLRELRIISLLELRYLPDSMQKLTLLKSMQLTQCDLVVLPEWLGDLTSLRELAFNDCSRLTSLPESIRKLTNLEYVHILGCRKLKDWCESEENKFKLAHIRPKYDVFLEPASQSPQSGDTSNIGYGNGAGGYSSALWPPSQHPSAGSIHMQHSLAPSSQCPNYSRPLGSPQRDIYLT